MFVPRAVRLKGVREPERNKSERPAKRARIGNGPEQSKTPDADLGSTQKEADPNVTKPVEKGPATKAAAPEYLAKLISGIELLFTDYAHQDKASAAWLKSHYRDVEGESKFIHLSAVLEHPYISLLKPTASQVLLQQALQEQSSPYLELSNNSYFVRRRPSTYPLTFVPSNSFEVVDDNGLSYWDQRTIYVEPHTRDLCKTPARVAHWLKEHGGMRDKWLPIQAVHTLYNSCAFVVLSGNVTHESTWQKWRKTEQPEYWKILTKVEHTKRTQEYKDLLAKEKAERDAQSNERQDKEMDNTKATRKTSAKQKEKKKIQNQK